MTLRATGELPPRGGGISPVPRALIISEPFDLPRFLQPMHHGHRPNPHVFAVDLDGFQEAVVGASWDRPILVDFWADWCSPCHALAPHLERVIDELGGAVRLAKVEVDEGENMKLAGHYRLRGFPTVILFQDGHERGRFSGARSTHQVRDWLGEHLGPQLGHRSGGAAAS
jgi:thioredoxin 1